jgi:hypothetical protein
MSQWGSSDAASNSVIWAPTAVRQAPTRANANLLYGNTTSNAYGDGQRITMLGVDSTEESVSTGKLAFINITNAGSGYTANATVTFSANNTGSGATANATANTSTGRIQVVNISGNGTGYTTAPVATVSAPSAIIFNGNTAVSGNTIALTSANSKFLVGDRLTYAGNTTSTPVGLTDQTSYYVSFANSTVIALSTTPNGANLAISPASGTSTTANGATLTGTTATAVVVIGGAKTGGIAHTGWVLRTEGTGGRAGRTQYEVLVAGGITTDGSDDQILHDA